MYYLEICHLPDVRILTRIYVLPVDGEIIVSVRPVVFVLESYSVQKFVYHRAQVMAPKAQR